MRALVVCAHPDDQVLLAGGYIKRLQIEGDIVKVLILSGGALSREDAKEEDVEHLKKETAEANMTLGVWKWETLNYPDNQFDLSTLLSLTQDVEDIIEEFKPDMVITHTDKDLNYDHTMTHRAVMIATRPQSGISAVLAGEVLSSTECNYEKAFKPNYFVDITRTIDAKVEAMRCYQSEIRDFPHPRSISGIRALSEYRGIQCNKQNAEAFEVVRTII